MQRRLLKTGLLVLAYIAGIGICVTLINQAMDRRPLSVVVLFAWSATALLAHATALATVASTCFSRKDPKAGKENLLTALFVVVFGAALTIVSSLLHDAYLFRS